MEEKAVKTREDIGLGAGKMTLLVKCLPCRWGHLSLDHLSSREKQGMLTQACILKVKVEASGSL